MRKIESISYIIVLFGISLDHGTTRYALTLPNIVEVNPLVVSLMEQNLWLFAEVFIVFTAVGIPFFVIRVLNRDEAYAILLYPVTHGILRTLAGIHNLGVIFK